MAYAHEPVIQFPLDGNRLDLVIHYSDLMTIEITPAQIEKLVVETVLVPTILEIRAQDLEEQKGDRNEKEYLERVFAVNKVTSRETRLHEPSYPNGREEDDCPQDLAGKKKKECAASQTMRYVHVQVHENAC